MGQTGWRFGATACAIICAVTALTQGAAQSPQPGKPDIADVIRRFAEAESENRVARNDYTFTQDFDVQTIGEGGSVTGRFHRVSEIVYDDRGVRFEKIIHFPPSTLRALDLTREDLQDLSGVQPFALATEDLAKYSVNYTGKERIDELDLYVFDVKPKQIIKGERYLEGRIWVDDRDLQIVKVAGKAVPEIDDQKFPRFESYRENIDGKYWFPTYIYVDDVLEFKKGPSVHVRMTVRFTNYKKFTGRIRMIDDGEAATEDDLKQADKNKQTPVKPPVKPPQEDKKKPPRQ